MLITKISSILWGIRQRVIRYLKNYEVIMAIYIFKLIIYDYLFQTLNLLFKAFFKQK